MRKFNLLLIGLVLLLLCVTSSFNIGKVYPASGNIIKDTLVKYIDGTYEARSQAKYTGEPFWGIVQLTIKGGSISKVNFSIRDSSIHETFNKKYKVHFKGNDLYLQQCKNDSRGVKKYTKKLNKTKDLDRVDVVSGATWSYNIFHATVWKALKNARGQEK
jgi:major membrane immunogen (membrane-anchored lipoprotein)